MQCTLEQCLLKVWSPDGGISITCKLAPNISFLKLNASEILGQGLIDLCFSSPLCDSGVCSTLRTTVLELSVRKFQLALILKAFLSDPPEWFILSSLVVFLQKWVRFPKASCLSAIPVLPCPFALFQKTYLVLIKQYHLSSCLHLWVDLGLPRGARHTFLELQDVQGRVHLSNSKNQRTFHCINLHNDLSHFFHFLTHHHHHHHHQFFLTYQEIFTEVPCIQIMTLFCQKTAIITQIVTMK